MKANLNFMNAEYIKQVNTATVYNIIDSQGPISRIEVAKLSQLAPASVTKITRSLLQAGLIHEEELQQSTGGRRAISIVSDRLNFKVLLVRMGKQFLHLGFMNLACEMLIETKIEMLHSDKSTSLNIWLQQQIDNFFQQNSALETIKTIAISIIVAGLIEAKAGVVVGLNQIKLDKSWELQKKLNQYYKLPIYLGHDIRCLALAEHYFGASQDSDDSLLLRIHHGVGTGIVINHEIFSANKPNIAELGHIQVDPRGVPCHCGNIGCLETVVSNDAIEKKMASMLQQGYKSSQISLNNTDIDHICLAANHNDEIAQQLIKDTGEQIGRVLAISVNMFNPQKIVISGDITKSWEVLCPAIRKTLEQHALNDFCSNLKIISSTLKHENLIGAFALVKEAIVDGRLLREIESIFAA